MKLFYAFIFTGLLLFTNTVSAQNCGNMGFESGNSSGWICRSGSYGSTSPATCGPADGPTNLTATGCLNSGGMNAPASGAGDRHVLMNQAGTDPNSNNAVTYVAPGSMFPSGTNAYSFRLGNGLAGGTGTNPNLAMAESIEYTFTVSAQNAGFTYMYSVFLMDPNHKSWESPRFEIRITRKVNGKDSLIDCGKFKVIAGVGTGAWKTGATDPTTSAPWKYTDWTKVGLDLTGFIGQQVTIQFITSDCFPASGTSTTCTNGVCTSSCSAGPGSHSAYAYIDMYCIPLQIDAPAVCANQSNIQICAPPGYQTYSWPAGQPGISTTYTTQCVTISSPIPGATYTVNMTSVAGGCPTSTTVTLKGFDFKLRDTAVCQGSPSFSLTATPNTTGTYNYSWSPPTGLSCANCQNPVVTPTTTRTYTVTMTDPSTSGCSQTKTVTVTVMSSTNVSATGATVCKGGSATISASGSSCQGPNTYSWDPPAGLSATNTATVTANPSQTTTYTVTFTDGAGSKATAVAIVVVNPLPTVTINNASICAGQSATLNAATADTYQWSTGEITASITVSPTLSTTYTLSGINNTGCSATASAVVTVNPMPTVTVNSVTICKGAQGILNATGADTYTWSPTIGLSASTGASVNASPPSDQTYIVMAATNAGCTGSAQASVKVNNCMLVIANDTTICFGECAILNATASVGLAPYTYSWSGGLTHLGTVCPASTTDYTVTATDVNGNTAMDVLTVTIQTIPTISTTPVAVCIGTCANLSASGAATYTWTPNTGLNNTLGNSVSACNLSANQTYTITGSTSAGCTNTNTVSVSINPLPTLSSSPATICQGTTTPLTVSGANTYTWSPTNSVNPTQGSTVTANPNATTTYLIGGSDLNGCSASTSVTVTVITAPLVTGNNATICVGQSATLNANGAISYTWAPSATLSSPNGSSVTATPGITTNYIITGANSTGCTGTTQVTVVVYPIPTLSTSNVQLCVGASTVVTVSGASTYTWSPATGLNTVNGNTVIANPTVSSVYTILGSSGPGCTSTTSVQVKVNPLPLIRAIGDTICQNDPASITASGASTYTWVPGNDIGSPITVSPSGTLTYTVTGTDANGCENTATAEVYVKPLPVADFTPDPATADINDPIISFYNKSINGITYKWTFGDGSGDTLFNTKHKYEAAGTYTVCLHADNQGCVSNICKTIIILPDWTFYVPNAFSPNGDGLNDTFIGVGTNILEYEMWVFDRWGNMIYHCTDMTKPWNGRRDNDLSLDVAQEDVYVWKIKIKDVFSKKHVYIGHVSIVK